MNPDPLQPHSTLVCLQQAPRVKADTAGSGDALFLGDLIGPDGAATLLALERNGKVMRFRGYLAPSLIAGSTSFLLTETSLAPCLLCGNIHGSGAGLLVTPKDPLDAGVAMYEAVDVSGRLCISEPDDAETETVREVGLVEATVRRAKPERASRLCSPPSCRCSQSRLRSTPKTR